MKMNENEMYENSSFVFAAQDNNILAALTNIFLMIKYDIMYSPLTNYGFLCVLRFNFDQQYA